VNEPVVPTLPQGLPPPDRFDGGADAPNPLLMVHRLLRGRYLAAFVLALVFALPFAYVGFKLREPKYRSTGLVRIAPMLPKLVYDTEDNRLLPHFESYVQAQVMILSSRRVLNRAVANKELEAAGWPRGEAGIAALERSLEVKCPPRSEMITVSVRHTDKYLAKAAVNAVLGAFAEVQQELGGSAGTLQEATLASLATQHEQELRQKRNEIATLAKPYGTTDLDPIFSRKAETVAALEAELRAIEAAIDVMRRQRTGAPAPGADVVNVDAMALTDQTLATLLDRKHAVESMIAVSNHLGPGHPEMRDMRQQLEALQRQIDERVAMLRAAREIGVGTLLAGASNMTLADLEAERDRCVANLEKATADFIELGRVRDKIAELTKEADLAESQLIDIRRTLHARKVESAYSDAGRVQIAQLGELPTGVDSDKRKIFALLGGAAGAGLGVGLVALFGLMRNGYRYIEDIEENPMAVPLLGTIPDLRAQDKEHDEMAALSVHHLRNMLQQSGPPGPRSVHAITSGSAGDGKTSLALALGMSYAVSGQRTVLLDADLVGRRLSRLLEKPKAPGLTELIGRDALNGEVHPTNWPNLWVIPAGIAGSTGEFSAERLSSHDFDRLLKQLRERFDQVIIDTGPVLGSLEATLVCPQADRVVVIVSAGQSPKVVEATIRKLNQLGARCAGMVFNRARRDDFDRSVSAAPFSRSIRSVPAREAGPAPTSSLVRALESERRDREQAGEQSS
jgi:succinoglycan biosynthesis transport protein ExoP